MDFHWVTKTHISASQKGRRVVLANSSQVRLGPLSDEDHKDCSQVWQEGRVVIRNSQKQRSQVKAGAQ